MSVVSKRVPAGDGVAWIVEGWRLLKMAPLMWLLAMVVCVVLFVLLGLLQAFGALVGLFLKVVLLAGFMVGCRELDRNGSFDLEHLLGGFRKNLVSLLILAAVMLVCLFVIVFITLIFMVITIGMQVLVQDPKDLWDVLRASGLSALLGLLVMLALLTPLAMAYWFAPALIALDGLGAFAAMKASFVASLRNFIPSLVYSVVMLLLACVAALPYLVGFIVWIPLAVASTYAAYRRIFAETPATEPVPATL
jgi:hypothetical protein